VPTLSPFLPILAVLIASAGFLGVTWRHCGGAALVRWGGRLALAMLCVLGGTTLLAAGQPFRGILPMGLLLGLLVVAILWERPEARGELNG
jgi:hypothetical protein